MYTNDVVQCSFVCVFKVIMMLPIELWFYVLIRNQATDHLAVLSQYTELDSKPTHFWKLLPVCVSQLQHFAILRPFFSDIIVRQYLHFTPKSMNKMLKRTIFLHINTFHKIYNHLHCFETNFSINLLFVLRQHLNQLTAAFILVALQENLVFLSAVFDQPFRWQLA